MVHGTYIYGKTPCMCKHVFSPESKDILDNNKLYYGNNLQVTKLQKNTLGVNIE